MKVIYSLLLIFSLSLTQFVATAQSQINGSELLGYWNLEFQTNGEASPGWLHAKRSGSRTIVGEFVGASGSTRPISIINFNPDNGNYTFTIPPQWESGNSDLSFTFSLAIDEIKGTLNRGIESVSFTGRPAPKLQRKSPPI